MEISLVISQEIKNTTAVRPSYFTWVNTQRTPHPYIEIVTPYAYSCFIHYSKKKKKWNQPYLDNKNYSSLKKTEILKIEEKWINLE